MKRIATIFLTLTLLLLTHVFIACSENPSTTTHTKTFCEIVSEISGYQVVTADNPPPFFTIGSDDSYCEIDTNPFDIDDYDSDLPWEYIEEMNKEFGLPEYLYNDMLHTSFAEGEQIETFSKIKVKYSYHPIGGLKVGYYRIHY